MMKKHEVGQLLSLLGVRAGDREAIKLFAALATVTRKERVAYLAWLAGVPEELRRLQEQAEATEARTIAAVADLLQHRMDWAIVQMHKDADPEAAQKFAAWVEELKGAILDGTWRVALKPMPKTEPESPENAPS